MRSGITWDRGEDSFPYLGSRKEFSIETHQAEKPSTANASSYERHPLDVIFNPQTVAVVGATEKEGSVGRTVFANLIGTPFGAIVFPVNPSRRGILGIKAYSGVLDLPEPIDLAVIVTPAQTVPTVIDQCVEVGVKGAIVISAGFKETGPYGAELERQILEKARQGKMHLIGPNCLGVMNRFTSSAA